MTGAWKNKNREGITHGRELGGQGDLPEVVTSNLRFSDKKKAGSYGAQGGPLMESNRERGSCLGKGTRVHEPGSHG